MSKARDHYLALRAKHGPMQPRWRQRRSGDSEPLGIFQVNPNPWRPTPRPSRLRRLWRALRAI